MMRVKGTSPSFAAPHIRVSEIYFLRLFIVFYNVYYNIYHGCFGMFIEKHANIKFVLIGCYLNELHAWLSMSLS